MKSLRMHYYLTDFISGILLICLPIYFKVFLGFSGFEVGVIYLIGGVVAVISSIVNSIIAQKIKNKKRVFNVSMLLLVAGVLYFNILLLLTKNITFYQAIFGSSLIFSMRSLLYVLGDEISTTYAEENTKVNYGKIRSFGSLGWGSNFLIMGMILVFLPKYFMICFLILTIILWINSFFLPTSKEQHSDEFMIKDIKELFKLKNYMIFLVFTTLMWGVLNNMNIYVEYAIVDNNGSLPLFYTLSIVLIIFDMLTMHFSTNILNILKPKKYLMLYVSLLLLKLGLLVIYPIKPLIYLVAILDPFIFGLLIPFIPLVIKTEVNRKLTTIAFMLSASFSLIFGSILSPFFGFIYDIYGSNITFLSMFIIIFIALITVLQVDLQKIKA